MIYLFATNDISVINKRMRKTILSHIGEINAFNYVKYDMRTTLFKDVLDDALNLPLGVDSRVIVLDHSSFLTTSNEKSVNGKISKEEIQELDELGEDIHLFFIARSNALDKRNALVKYIEEKGTIALVQDYDHREWIGFIKTYFNMNKTEITEEAVNKLADAITNASTFMEEVQKLLLQEEKITIEHINTLITPPVEQNSFALVNTLLSGDKKSALKIYRDFLVQNQEPIVFIIQVANQFRLFAQVFTLHEAGKTNEEIAEYLKVHAYRVKIAMDMRRKTTLKEVLDVLLRLSDLDYKIKSGQIDRYFGFEMFLINY